MKGEEGHDGKGLGRGVGRKGMSGKVGLNGRGGHNPPWARRVMTEKWRYWS